MRDIDRLYIEIEERGYKISTMSDGRNGSTMLLVEKGRLVGEPDGDGEYEGHGFEAETREELVRKVREWLGVAA